MTDTQFDFDIEDPALIYVREMANSLISTPADVAFVGGLILGLALSRDHPRASATLLSLLEHRSTQEGMRIRDTIVANFMKLLDNPTQ